LAGAAGFGLGLFAVEARGVRACSTLLYKREGVTVERPRRINIAQNPPIYRGL